MVDEGRVSAAWWGTAAAALGLMVLGDAWPGRLPGAGVAVEILLVCAGALLGRALLVERSRPLADVLGVGLRILLVPFLVLIGVAVAVQCWSGVPDWGRALEDVRSAALTGRVQPDTPVATLWLAGLLAQAALLVLVLRWVASRVSGIETIVLVLSIASFASWAVDAADHLAARFWAVGLGLLVSMALGRRSVPTLPPSTAVLAWLAGVAVAGVAVLVEGPLPVTVVGAVLGLILAIAGPAAGSPTSLVGGRVAVWLAAIAWAVFCVSGPALRLVPDAVGHELGLRARAGLLLVVGALALVTVVVLAVARRIVRHPVAWAGVLVVAASTAVLVTVPGLQRVEAIEDDAARVERLVTADLPDCFGAAEMAARAEGGSCDNPALEGTASPGPERIGTDFEGFMPCWSQPFVDEVNVCELGARTPDAPRVLVLGDSHARVLFAAFRRLADHGVLTVDATAKASCAWGTNPIKDRDPARVASCQQWRANLAAWLDDHAADYDVIVTSAYNGRMVGPRERQVQGLVDAWEPVARAGVPIVALRDNPRLEGDPVDCLLPTDPAQWSACDVAREDVVSEFDPFGPAAKRVEGASFVDTWRFFCDADTCPVVIGGVGVYRDYNHLTATYGESLAPFLYGEIARTGVFTE